MSKLINFFSTYSLHSIGLLASASSSHCISASEQTVSTQPITNSDVDPFQAAPLPDSFAASIPQDPSIREGSSAELSIDTRYYRCSLTLSYQSLEGLVSNSAATFPAPSAGCTPEEDSDGDGDETPSTGPLAAIFSIDLSNVQICCSLCATFFICVVSANMNF